MIESLIVGGITGKGILKYTFLPQITPRLKNLIGSGFANLSYFMAMVYQAVKLLPSNHPYLNSNSIGKYSIRDVLSEASNNLQFNIKHIDQIIIFFALIIGIIILGIQFFLLLTAFFIKSASAAEMPAGFGEFFTTASPTEDIAFRLLDRVFGIPELFGSQEPTESAFHTALHGLFQFYSIGLLVIAAIILVYFIFVVLAETAQTGTPFGKRYNHVWVPIRLVAAFGLLIPISYGLNSGQWITLHAAKMGSGFATNGWNKFNETLREDNPIKEETLIAEPNIPELKDLSSFMMIAHACKAAYIERNADFGNSIEAYLLSPDGSKNPIVMPVLPSDAIRHTNGENFTIRFGRLDTEYTEQTGNVFPFCGDLVIPNEEPIPELVEDGGSGSEGDDDGPDGSYTTSPYGVISGRYYSLVYRMWQKDAGYGEKMAEAAEKIINNNLTHDDPEYPENTLREEIQEKARAHMQDGLDIALQKLNSEIPNDDRYKKYGWGGAGIWYNHIAGVNGKLTDILLNKPQIKSYPSLMMYTCEENLQQNQNAAAGDCYDPHLSQGEPVKFVLESDSNAAQALNTIHDYWHEDPDGMTANAIINVINVMFGTQGLFDMCKNADVHPLAQLSSMGKGLVDSAIRNIGIGLGLGIASIIPVVGPTAGALSSMAMTFASIGILIGFMLYYIIPFLPFLYFLFAVGGWIKGLFEAMVGVPLWALSHLRIDGQGLPGDGGINGYFLIFEIFIRPILIVFGLIAAVLTFGAMVKVLNEIFGIVIHNLSGNDPTLGEACFTDTEADTAEVATKKQDMIENFRGPVDEFFYTIVYAILVYMIGMASFKLIDLIPNNILRWMGQGVQTFNDQAGEPADGLMTKMAVGGSLMGGQLQSAGQQGGQAIAGLGKAGANFLGGGKS